MKNILTVMKFTMKEMIKRKSFIISTLIILALIVLGFNVPRIIKSFQGEATGEKLLIVDSDDVFEGNLVALNQYDLGYELEFDKISYDEIAKKLEIGNIDSCIIIEKTDDNIKMRYVVENLSLMDEVPEKLINSLNALYTNIQISKLGLTEEQLS